MKEQTKINVDQRNGNLHINLEGIFTPKIAVRLAAIMAKMYQGRGNIFIHTKRVTEVEPDSHSTFNKLLRISGLPADNVYLTGEKGLAISHDSSKVIVHTTKKHNHGGCGRCENCSCQNKEAA
jgi:hypothetical protein